MENCYNLLIFSLKKLNIYEIFLVNELNFYINKFYILFKSYNFLDYINILNINIFNNFFDKRIFINFTDFHVFFFKFYIYVYIFYIFLLIFSIYNLNNSIIINKNIIKNILYFQTRFFRQIEKELLNIDDIYFLIIFLFLIFS